MKSLFMKGLPLDDKNMMLTPKLKAILNERIKKVDGFVYGGSFEGSNQLTRNTDTVSSRNMRKPRA